MSDSPIFILNDVVISSGDMSQATLTSSAIEIKEGRHAGLMATWTGTAPVGIIALQGSNDGIHFAPIQTAVAVSGNSGTQVINIPNVAFPFVNALYTKTSGTGTLTVSISLKL